jgi:hypothetical protein
VGTKILTLSYADPEIFSKNEFPLNTELIGENQTPVTELDSSWQLASVIIERKGTGLFMAQKHSVKHL